MIHVKEYAAVDATAIINLGDHAELTWFHCLGVGCNWARRGVWVLCWPVRECWRCVRRAPARVGSDGRGGHRALATESESEAEEEDKPCYAVRVGVKVQGEMRPLAPEGCSDSAAPEATALLIEDAAVSDVDPPSAPGGTTTIALCEFHSQMYRAASAPRKCGVSSCHHEWVGAREGVPLCRRHLGGANEAEGRRQPQGFFAGLRRRGALGEGAGPRVGYL